MARSPWFVVIGNPDSRRVAFFQAALAGLGRPAAMVVSYLDLINGRTRLADVMQVDAVLRIESPGQDFAVERALLAAGAGAVDEQGPTRLTRDQALHLALDRGRIRAPTQWYQGFNRTLQQIERQRDECPPRLVMNPPEAIAAMFDKAGCALRFQSASVPSPPAIAPARSYDELRARMEEHKVRRVFVKLRYASSASGVAALAVGPRGAVAYSTVEMVSAQGELRLYNSRRIRRYEREREIATLIDALCREGAHVERWLPKASLCGQTFDLRVVVIDGCAAHAVVRLSRTPMTNLHLSNDRAEIEVLRRRMPEDAWEAVADSCVRALGVFPGALYAGVDVVIAPGYRRHAVLEVNAFGDLLPGALHGGLDTYTAELAALGASRQEAVR